MPISKSQKMPDSDSKRPEDLISSTKAILELPENDFQALVRKHVKHKDRSDRTHHELHVPALAALPTASLTIVLLGDSRLERFSWYAPDTKINHLAKSFNAGVGGDKIENVLYRIEQGLLRAMEDKIPKLWVLSIGTNNLRVKGRDGLKEDEIEAFVVLVAAILRAAPESTVLMTELSYRKDIDEAIVDVVNRQFLEVLKDFNAAFGMERAVWHELPVLTKEQHLLDHVHFNKEGYRMWDAKLFNHVQALLETA